MKSAIRFRPEVQVESSDFDSKTELFYFLEKEWQQKVAENHPYRLAKIVHHNHDLSKRWYVLYYAWDVSKSRLVRKRLFDSINKKTSVNSRLREAENIMHIVNAQLLRGGVLGKDAEEKQVHHFQKMTLLECIRFVRDEKAQQKYRASYIKHFNSLITIVNDWYAYDFIKDIPITEFTSESAHALQDYLIRVRKTKEKSISNRSVNNHMLMVTTVINYIYKRRPDLFKKDPLISIDRLPVHTKKHAAYSLSQISTILKECEGRSDQFLLFIQFIYYLLARPKELLALKVQDIDMVNGRILFRAEISKNKRDEYAGIPGQLREIIIKSGILNYPGNNFIFSRADAPSLKGTTTFTYWKRNRAILDKLSITDREYTLYSYKHTGAIALYRYTKDIKLVQLQCRHVSIEMTNKYLRDLGESGSFEGLEKFVGQL